MYVSCDWTRPLSVWKSNKREGVQAIICVSRFYFFLLTLCLLLCLAFLLNYESSHVGYLPPPPPHTHTHQKTWNLFRKIIKFCCPCFFGFKNYLPSLSVSYQMLTSFHFQTLYGSRKQILRGQGRQFLSAVLYVGVRGSAVGWNTLLKAWRSRVWFPVVFFEIFHWLNPSGRSVVLGCTQPVTEMSTRNIPSGIKAAGA
jgi:hypothetical protein